MPHHRETWWPNGSVTDSGSSGPGSRPGQSFCVVFLGKALYFHSVSLHPQSAPLYLGTLISTIVHFTVACSVTWPLNGSEAGGDLALIQTSLLYYVNAN